MTLRQTFLAQVIHLSIIYTADPLRVRPALVPVSEKYTNRKNYAKDIQNFESTTKNCHPLPKNDLHVHVFHVTK